MTEAGITGQQVLTVRREYAMDFFRLSIQKLSLII